MNYQYDLRIAGVRIRILAPREITLPENFLPFRSESSAKPDVLIEVFFGTGDVTASQNEMIHRITHCGDAVDILRIEPAVQGHPYRLVIPEKMADDACSHGNWLLYLPLERLLLPFQRVILHASAVIYRGEAYVFTAPSGTGKSTQAEIWHREYGAEILNGDKVVLAVENGRVTAYGSPVAGSSGIYKNSSAPVAAVIQLKQGDRNSIVNSNNRSGYFAIYSGLVKSRDDQAFNQRLLPHIEQILESIPVLTLTCRPDRQAAQCVLDCLDENRIKKRNEELS